MVGLLELWTLEVGRECDEDEVEVRELEPGVDVVELEVWMLELGEEDVKEEDG